MYLRQQKKLDGGRLWKGSGQRESQSRTLLRNRDFWGMSASSLEQWPSVSNESSVLEPVMPTKKI